MLWQQGAAASNSLSNIIFFHKFYYNFCKINFFVGFTFFEQTPNFGFFYLNSSVDLTHPVQSSLTKYKRQHNLYFCRSRRVQHIEVPLAAVRLGELQTDLVKWEGLYGLEEDLCGLLQT